MSAASPRLAIFGASPSTSPVVRRRPARAHVSGFVAIACALAAAPAGAAPLGTACPGPGAAAILLLPEDAAAIAVAPSSAITVTGAYTAIDRRAGDLPKPVGLFIHRGAPVSLEFARMDGILVVEADGAARIAAVTAAPLGGVVHDLASLEGRRSFARAAAEAGASVLQTHLLIRDGALDLRVVPDAPRAARRLLLGAPDGALTLWQSGPRALTLHEAASEVLAAHAPAMALNLDTGSYDFCERDGGVPCGLLTRDATGRLSNLLRLFPDPECAVR